MDGKQRGICCAVPRIAAPGHEKRNAVKGEKTVNEPDQTKKQTDGQAKKVFFLFLIGVAAVGVLLTAFSFLLPHRTGVVTYVGRVSRYTAHSGVGKNSSEHTRFAADVRVRVKGSSETATVYYREGDPENIPKVGDEIEFADYPLTGNGPYPQAWAVKTGLFVLGLDALAYTGYLIAALRKKRKAET